jgi:hypothetical protein
MEGAILLELERPARHYLSALTSLLQRFLPLTSNSNEYHPLHLDVCGKRSVCLSAHRTKSHLLPSDDNISRHTTSHLPACLRLEYQFWLALSQRAQIKATTSPTKVPLASALSLAIT